MAGHSKWSKVKRFKGAIDAKRGKIFSKLSKHRRYPGKLCISILQSTKLARAGCSANIDL
jgi:transcriptional/translational regulatory protein YebC/TACO1